MLLLPLCSLMVSIVFAQPPNIIVIVADDLGYNYVSWHNDAVIMPQKVSP
jgi:arylsulfatase A-like enzyme